MKTIPSQKLLIAVAAALLLSGCGTAQYIIKSQDNDLATGKPKIIQTVSADAPGGDAFVVVVYYGPNVQPTVNSGGDSTALVEATAAAGRSAIQLVAKAALAP